MNIATWSRSLLAGVAALALAAPAGAVNIGIVPAGNTVDIVVSDLGGEAIAAYDIDLAFDSTLFSVLDVTFSGLLGDFAAEETDQYWDSAGGVVDLYEVSFLSDDELSALQGGSDFTLLSILFDGDVSNADFRFIWDAFNDVKCRDNRVCFPVATPEPGTLALLGLGLLGMAIGRRRRVA
jgi:hypothetical protein